MAPITASHDSTRPPDSGPPLPEWIERLTAFLSHESNVEAIRIDPGRQRVSVATLGQVDADQLQRKLEGILQSLDAEHLESQTDLRGRAGWGITIRRLPGETLIEKPTCPTAPILWKWREFAWPEPEELESRSREEWRTLALQAGICGIALAVGFILAKIPSVPGSVSVLFYGISLVAGAWDAAIDTWRNLHRRRLDIHFLMLAVAAGAVAIGAWTEGTLLLFLFSASGAMEHYALHRTHREISALTRHAPKTANVLVAGGATEERDVRFVEVDDHLLVKPDEAFPVDGEIVDGETAADESTLTGESTAVSKHVGDPVFSGTLNTWGAVEVRVTHRVSESALQKIIDLIQQAQHLRAPSQRFTDRFGTGYTYAILAMVTAMFFVWWLALDLPPFANSGDSKSAFYRAMTLLVVASPCALVLSIPSAILAAIAWSARKGILFRGGAAIEKLAEIDTIALDKTGTLTRGELAVRSIESFPPGRESDIAAIAFSLENNSNHPIARAITAHGKREKLAPRAIDEFRSITGKGLRGIVDGEVTWLGRRELLADNGLADWIDKLPDPPVAMTEVWIVQPDLMGRILLQDEIREESRAVLDALAARGIHTLMLTGDRRSAAESVAEQLGVREVRSGLHPEDKVEAIRTLTESGRKVAMVGDGVNDAPSLAAAWVSVAMGGRGSDAALEQSDVVLMRDRIDKLLTALRISVAARRIIKQNLAISLGTILVMVTLALLGKTQLTIGVVAHEGSTVLVCLNSLRLLFLREQS